MAAKKEGGRGMSAFSSTFWQTAPASAAVVERPVQELFYQKKKLEQWSEALRVIEDLLAEPDVCEVDRLALAMERVVAKCGALACANVITACEERIRKDHARMQRTHGHLL